GVEAGSIVGAIANEGGIEGRFINNITIKDTFTLVDLPKGMPADILQHLQKTRVKGRPLNIREWSESTPAGGAERKPAPRRDASGSSDRKPAPRRRSE
ncbi:MAG: ATP-dependent RNA helicase DeaD, partial [Granulosicoccus sp.]